jgi:hypothetical protein
MTDTKEHGITTGKPMTVEQREHTSKDEAYFDKTQGIERVMSPDDDMIKDHTNYDRVDSEVAKYAGQAGVEVSEAESQRLKKMINKRVLAIMVFTYFLQALDKGTMSFASIMNIRQDLHLVGQQVWQRKYLSQIIVSNTV